MQTFEIRELHNVKPGPGMTQISATFPDANGRGERKNVREIGRQQHEKNFNYEKHAITPQVSEKRSNKNGSISAGLKYKNTQTLASHLVANERRVATADSYGVTEKKVTTFSAINPRS